MRRVLLLLACFISLFGVFSCHNTSSNNNAADQISPNLINIPASANNESNGKLPKMVFADTNYDFGSIKEGDKVTHIFVFKNEGQGDLVIAGATASCGCTTPTYPHTVKHPGDTGTISVTFDSSNKTGKMVKEVTITCNAQPPLRFLTINANIQPSNN